MIAGCGWCRTYIQRQACRHRKSGAAHRTPFFCKSLSCTKHHAACQASCVSFTQTSRMRWECGRVAAASVSALSLFPAACSTAVLCYRPPRAFFFSSIPLFRQPHRRASCRAAAAAAAAACCCLLLAACCSALTLALTHTHTLSSLILSRSPHLSCVCLLAGGSYAPLLLSATNTATTSTSSPPPPPTQPSSPYQLSSRRESVSPSSVFCYRGSSTWSVVPSEQGGRKGSEINTRTHTPYPVSFVVRLSPIVTVFLLSVWFSLSPYLPTYLPTTVSFLPPLTLLNRSTRSISQRQS